MQFLGEDVIQMFCPIHWNQSGSVIHGDMHYKLSTSLGFIGLGEGVGAGVQVIR